VSVGQCQSRAAAAREEPVVRLATFAMGTRFEFVLVGDDESHLRAVGEEAVAEIQYLHEKFSYFSASSIVTRINQRAAQEPVDVDRETFELLESCREVWEQSDGAFDITIAPLMHRYGFRESAHREGAVSQLGMGCVELDRDIQTIRFAQPGMAIDLGGVAKGLALDRAAAICRENCITCGLLHGGTSTVIAIGSPPDDDRGWAVRIHDEVEPTTAHLRDQALSVSAPRGRVVESDGTSRGHVIDPRSGEPASGVMTAAVIGPHAVFADAWSTALLVLQARPATLCRTYVSWIRKVNAGWEGLPAGCRHAAID